MSTLSTLRREALRLRSARLAFGPASMALLASALGSLPAGAALAPRVRFLVLDKQSHRPLPGAQVEIAEDGHAPWTLWTGLIRPGPTVAFDLARWRPDQRGAEGAELVTLVEGQTVALQSASPAEPPLTEIKIVVRATRAPRRTPSPTTGSTTLDTTQIARKTGAVGGRLTNAVQGTAGVAADSAGQIHVRGEHADISYVVDGIPLPDTLSGRQSSIVSPSTIRSLEILTGAFAPEFGGQAAAVLNVETQPGVSRAEAGLAVEAGSFDTTNLDLTAAGPLGKRASYVFDFGATRTRLAAEPQQPDNQTAHNTGSDLTEFAKLRFAPGKRDALTFTLSRSPGTLEVNNRAGLGARYALAGQGFGFQGLRNADGSRPGVDPDSGLLGAGNILLPSQERAGQDITQREVSEFATLAWRRQLGAGATSNLALTLLHSGQDVHNHNPAVDLLNLPVDNSIEYNPTAIRNVHHVQIAGNLASAHGRHQLKAGFVLDDQVGDESYNLVPASQLALNQLAATAPGLAPAGAVLTGPNGPLLDVNGNPVYRPSSASTPNLQVHRSGFYRAAYLQDTWRPFRRTTFNYGLRGDWYRQTQSLGQAVVDTADISPRLNLSYALDRLTLLRASYNRIFNTPPLAQGAVVGQPIQPELVDQYDISAERTLGGGQSLHIAYYVKQIRNQVDTGLLIPGSQIGIYSAVNFQYGGVHGIEFSYDVAPRGRSGFDLSLNYSYSIARPNGLDNTGAPVPIFNDHDQRNTVGLDLGYTWKSGAAISADINYGSGLASSAIAPSALRNPRSQVNFQLASSPRLLWGHGSVGLSVDNLFDDRTVINFESAFSGTRFQEARRVLCTVKGSF